MSNNLERRARELLRNAPERQARTQRVLARSDRELTRLHHALDEHKRRNAQRSRLSRWLIRLADRV